MSIMQEQPSRYTAYARSLCPTWCTEDHVEPTDKNDLGAVHHRGQVGAFTVTDCGNYCEALVDVRVGRWDSLDADSDGRTAVVLWTEVPDYLTSSDAMKVAQLLARAAEVADRG